MAGIVERLNQIQFQYLKGVSPSSSEERLENARDILWRALRQASIAQTPENLAPLSTLSSFLGTDVTWNSDDNFTLEYGDYDLTQDEDDDVMSTPNYSGGNAINFG